MPEIAEIKIMADGLQQLLCTTENYLFEFDFNPGKAYDEYYPELLQKFRPMLPLKIERITTNGKKIIVHLADQKFLVGSMGMSGTFRTEKQAHSDLWFTFGAKDSKERNVIYFNDPRKFGLLEILFSEAELTERLSGLGPDLLANDISLEDFKKLLSKKSTQRRKMYTLMLDQEFFSGCGNYLKSDILRKARIHPERILGSLSEEEFKRLHESTLTIMRKSYSLGGYSLEDYVDINGIKGKYEPLIYNRETDFEGYKVTVKHYSTRVTYIAEEVQKI